MRVRCNEMVGRRAGRDTGCGMPELRLTSGMTEPPCSSGMRPPRSFWWYEAATLSPRFGHPGSSLARRTHDSADPSSEMVFSRGATSNSTAPAVILHYTIPLPTRYTALRSQCHNKGSRPSSERGGPIKLMPSKEGLIRRQFPIFYIDSGA